jgi:hypothetical protein
MLALKAWKSPPERLPDGFTMTKPEGAHIHVAVCEAWTHPFGWETRLMIDDHGMQMTSVVQSAAEMLKMVEEWRSAMVEKGWSRPAASCHSRERRYRTRLRPNTVC